MAIKLAAAASGLAIAAIREQREEEESPPTCIPAPLVPKLTGKQWVHQILANEKRCFDNFRMKSAHLLRLHETLVHEYGLCGTRQTGSLEKLAIFVWTLAQQAGCRLGKDRFDRSIATISCKMTEMAELFTRFADDIIGPLDPTYSSVHGDLREFEPYFDGCIGALDGTHIDVIVNKGRKEDYRNRHGDTSINVLAIVDMDMRFTFVGADRAGACHDASVLTDCKKAVNFPHPPKGRYYVVDSAYSQEQGYMGPYRGMYRKHIDEFKGVDRRKLKYEEHFNYAHSKIRNVVERTFGVCKKRWKILDGVPLFEREKQVQIIVACFALNNWVWKCKNGSKATRTYPLSEWVYINQDKDTESLRDDIAAGIVYDINAKYWPTAGVGANADDGDNVTKGFDGLVGGSGVDVGEGTSGVALQQGQQAGSGVDGGECSNAPHARDAPDGNGGPQGWSWFENWNGSGCSYGQISHSLFDDWDA